MCIFLYCLLYLVFMSYIKHLVVERCYTNNAFVGDVSEGMRGAPPTQTLGLVATDLVFVCKLSRQELVIFICFRKQRRAAPTAPEFKSASPPLSPPLSLSLLFVCVSGVRRHAALHLKRSFGKCANRKLCPNLRPKSP